MQRALTGCRLAPVAALQATRSLPLLSRFAVAAPPARLSHSVRRRLLVAAHAGRHGQAQRDPDQRNYTCHVCNVRLRGKEAWQEHLNSTAHRESVAAFAEEAEDALGDLDTLNRFREALLPHCAPFQSVAEGHAALGPININIFDLIEERFKPVFSDVDALAEYFIRNGRVFPLREAKADGNLKIFLRHLIH